MQAIENGLAGVALVIDGGGRLAGMVTDGDIRRALLGGAGLDAPVARHMQPNYTSVSVEAGRAEVLDLMQSLRIHQIPVVDKDRKLLGMHLLHELLGSVERPHWAVIMAGGRGTRLASLTDHLPKPMIRVAGRPILERLILHLVSFGFRRVFLSVNYLAQVIIDHFGDGSRFGCAIEYLRETEPLGTGGSLSLLAKPPIHPLIVLNGDLVTQANLSEMVEFHERGGYIATIGVRQYGHRVPFGCLELDGERVIHFEEKPVLEKIVNAGIYVLSPSLIARVPKSLFAITTLLEECLQKREPLGAFEIQEDWLDVGHRDQLRQAQQGH
jgi:dTDP-glucose pyrophosphorylase